MSSGANRAFRGTYTGTGALVTVSTIGFRPRGVRLTSEAGDEATWNENMADDSMHKRTAAGTGSLVTSNAVTPLGNGFSIGTDGDLNASGEVVHFEAWD